MTVADIKEFIDKITSDIYSAYYNNYGELDYDEKEVKEIVDNRDKILSMLDELGDIKEYINKRIKECDEEYENHDRIYGLCLDHRDVSNELEKVRDMLDELKENNK